MCVRVAESLSIDMSGVQHPTRGIPLTAVGLAGDPDKALCASRLPRAWPRLLLAAVCVPLAVTATDIARARADAPARIEDVEDSLRRDSSYKVRVNAAI